MKDLLFCIAQDPIISSHLKSRGNPQFTPSACLSIVVWAGRCCIATMVHLDVAYVSAWLQVGTAPEDPGCGIVGGIGMGQEQVAVIIFPVDELVSLGLGPILEKEKAIKTLFLGAFNN